MMDSRFLLPLIILIEGFISIGIEILTIRQLLPVAGSSVIVTSLVIGIFLLFLAMGYRQGGRMPGNLQKKLRYNFIIASVWLGVGLSSIFISIFFSYVQSVTGHIVYSVLIYLSLIIAPLIYLLGQTVPITMNMIRQSHSAGVIGGDALGLSTLGSFLGATITALVTLHYFGVAWTVFINFALLIVLFFLLSENLSGIVLKVSIAAGLVAFIYGLNIKTEYNAFLLTDNYADYKILDHRNSVLHEGEKILVINNSIASYTNTLNQGFPYIEQIKKILFQEMKIKNADILVLGAGGFTLSAENTYGNRFTYVDIDKKISKVVVPAFLEKIKGALVVDDARHFLLTTKDKYAVIISDAYSNTISMPSHLLTREYVSEVQHRLLQDGVAIFNIIAKPNLADPYSKRIDNTIRSVFRNCNSVPLHYANAVTNILYVCTNASNQADKTIYSDNLNTVTTDYFEW
jgi:spermidine synthase